jgi:hypothetical protein
VIEIPGKPLGPEGKVSGDSGKLFEIPGKLIRPSGKVAGPAGKVIGISGKIIFPWGRIVPISGKLAQDSSFALKSLANVSKTRHPPGGRCLP